MSEERVNRFLQMIRRDLMRQAAGNQSLKEAEQLLERGNLHEAEKKLIEAAQAFETSALEYRQGKSFKKAALLMCNAGDVYSEIGNSTQAINAYSLAAEDLLHAAEEHLIWDDPAEIKRGTALAISACMIYFMVGDDNTAFLKARQFVSDHSAKIVYPDVVRLSQIPQQFEAALVNVDINSFSSAENSVATELKTALGRDAESFYRYVEKGLGMIREIFRGKIKTPNITSHIELPVDKTFSDEFTIKAILNNIGDGNAFDLAVEWHLDPELVVSAGDIKRSIEVLGPDESITLEIVAKASQELTGTKEYSVLLKGTYRDQLNTEYSLQVGPAKILLKDFRETEKLQHDRDVTDGRIGLLRTSVEQSILEQEPLSRMIDALTSTLMRVNEDISGKNLEAAKTRISIVNELIDAFDSLLGDDLMISEIKAKREKALREHGIKLLQELEESIKGTLESIESELREKILPVKQEIMDLDAKRKEVFDSISSLKSRIADINYNLELIYNGLPTASSTQDPAEAAARTKVRTALEEEREKIKKIQSYIASLLEADYLADRTVPEVPERIRVALESLEQIRRKLLDIFNQKQSSV